MNPELELWIELKPGTAVRVRMTVVEEGLPTPGEKNAERQPHLPEIIAAAYKLHHERLTILPPF